MKNSKNIQVGLIKFLISILIFTSSDSLLSQMPLWPSSDAEWHYSITNHMSWEGYSLIKIERDTLLDGNDSQIYSRTIKGITQINPNSYDTITLNEGISLITSLKDSVLLTYNFNNLIFDTIIDFKANVGDSWKTYIHNESCFGEDNNSFIKTEVVNKDIISINGQDLLQFVLIRDGAEYGAEYDTIVQMIGSMHGNFNYNKFCPNSIEYYYENNLRCFSFWADGFNQFQFNQSGEECDYLPTLNIENQVMKLDGITIVNPVIDNVIKLKNIDFSKVKQIKMYSAIGQEIDVLPANENDELRIYIKNNIQSGFYYIHLVSDQQKLALKVIVKN